MSPVQHLLNPLPALALLFRLPRSARIQASALAATSESALVIGSVLYLARRNRPVSAPAERDRTRPWCASRVASRAAADRVTGELGAVGIRAGSPGWPAPYRRGRFNQRKPGPCQPVVSVGPYFGGSWSAGQADVR